MARNQIDTIDLVALIALPLAAGIELGVWSLSLDAFASAFSFSDPLVTIGGSGISTAFLATMASIAGLVVSGSLTEDNFQQEEWYAIVAALLVVPLYVFVPAVGSLINYSGIIPLVVWLALSGVAVFISYKA
jgi:hypothetical protein